MKKIILILLISISFFIKVSAQNDCERFYNGTFTMDVGTSKIVIERNGKWQYEVSEEYGIEYLNKIEKTDDCSYYLYRYKVIKEGVLPKPNMEEKALVEIIKIENDDFYFKSKIIEKESWLEGKITKLSDEISEKFKFLISKYNK